MSQVRERMRQHVALLRILAADGEGARSVDERCHAAESFRAESPDGSQRLDRVLFERIDQLSQGLSQAQSSLNAMKELLDKLTASPWTAGVFLRAVDTPGGRRAMVCHGHARRVVNLAEGLDLGSLQLGDEVFLNNDASAVISKSVDGQTLVGETGIFDRYTDDRRLVLKWRDEEFVVEAAGPLSRIELASGDEVRWDRGAWLAYERIERAAGRQYLSAEVPDVQPDQVGGQRRAVQALLNLLTARFKEPEAAAMYRQNGKKSALMVGPPGCGKTLIARFACAEVSRMTGKNCRFSVVKPGEFLNEFVGVTERNIRNAFQALNEAAAAAGLAVLFMDEIESVGRVRGSVSGHHSDRFLNALLTELDGFADRGDVAIMAATNRPDLCDPAILERFEVEIAVARPDMRGAREIFNIHLPESMPYSPDGEAAPATRAEIVDRAVSRLYSPNGENQLCVIRFRDGKERTILARELVSGRSIEQICRATGQKAFLRYVHTGEHGVRAEDMDESVSEVIQRLSTVLTPRNAHAYLADLPQDIDVVSVMPITRRAGPGHNYLSDS